jgi:hypothetical protein
LKRLASNVQIFMKKGNGEIVRFSNWSWITFYDSYRGTYFANTSCDCKVSYCSGLCATAVDWCPHESLPGCIPLSIISVLFFHLLRMKRVFIHLIIPCARIFFIWSTYKLPAPNGLSRMHPGAATLFFCYRCFIKASLCQNAYFYQHSGSSFVET